jgi:hypothetical protein
VEREETAKLKAALLGVIPKRQAEEAARKKREAREKKVI